MEEDKAGKAKGGFARAKKLSAEERSKIAQQAAKKRWEISLPKAEYKGILKIGDGLRCFVLDDGRRVISGRGITAAIGMKGRGLGLPWMRTPNSAFPTLSADATRGGRKILHSIFGIE